MFLGIITLITALSISAVAIYYSVAGLVAIFAAAAIPIIIMGGVLEVGKLVTAVWLHKYWDRATWWLKAYLGTAVIVLMFITSMGIFGFLSKAHIEQTAAAGEGVAQIEQIDGEIARQQAVITRAEQKIENTQTSGTGADQNIQAQIDREQERIDTAYDRVQPAIDATREQLKSDRQFYLDQLPVIDDKLAQLDDLSNIDTNDQDAVKRLQTLVGARPDGAYGGGTARAVRNYRESLQAERADILAKVEELKANANEEIVRLRSRAETEIDDSNQLINRLRGQLGQSTGEDIDAIIAEENARIKAANTELDALTEEKFQLEADYRKLEAEVGPIKYIAEFIYGDQADKNLLEEAVRWVIIVIILVFDPLAVLLLIASQYTFNWYRSEHEITKEEGNESDGTNGPTDPDGDGSPNGKDRGSEESVQEEQADDFEQGFSEEDPVSREERDAGILEEDNVVSDATIRDVVSDHDVADATVAESTVDQNKIQPDEQSRIEEWNKMIEEAEQAVLEEDEEDTELADANPVEKSAMQKWKAEDPNNSLKIQRALFRAGKIDRLPWEKYLEAEADFQEDEDPDAVEAAKWAQEQLEKSKKKDSDLDGETGLATNQTEQELVTGYVQNAEQNEITLWEKIKREQ